MYIEKKKNNISCFSLDNKLKVIVIEDHRTPIITHMVWYKAGAADEVLGKSGTAHFLEHLMFKGTSKTLSGEHSKIITKNGGYDNAFTGHDYTCYYERLSVDKLDIAMKLESDRMVNLFLNDKILSTERDVIIEERKQCTDNRVDAIHFEQMNASLYLSHPYAIPVIGWNHEILILNQHDVSKFYKKYYIPNNAILVVAGDIIPELVLNLAEKYYGGIPLGNIKKRKRVTEPPHLCARQVNFCDKRVKQPQWIKQYLVPSFHTLNINESNESEALQIAMFLLVNSFSSHLYIDLVIKKKILVTIGGWYNSISMDYSPLGFFAIPRKPYGLNHIDNFVNKSIAEFIINGISDEKLLYAKNLMLAKNIYIRDNHNTIAKIIGSSLSCEMSLDYILNWSLRIKKLSKDQIINTLNKYINEETSVTGFLLGKEKDLTG